MNAMKMKRMLAGLAAAACLMLFAGAAAAEWREAPNLWDGAVTADARSLGLPKKTKLPVYAAPGEEDWRGANGKASVALSDSFRLLGQTEDRVWQLIEYDLSKGARRVGWIRLPEGAAVPEISELPVTGVLCETLAPTALTDDPRGGGRAMGELPAGARASALFEADGWLYVAARLDGKRAAGFAPASAFREVPMVTLRGRTVVVAEGVEQIGSPDGWWDTGDSGDAPGVWRGEELAKAFGRVAVEVYGGDLLYDEATDTWAESDAVSLPSTLAWIGAMALEDLRADELVIPEGVTAITASDAFYSMSIGTLRLPASLTAFDPGMALTYTDIGRYETAPGSAAFMAKDGVLFSGDGRVLVSYPSGAKAAHYDVPAGTKEIGPRAFSCDFGALPLVTVSLPAGLRSIGRRAFSECGNLIAIAVPPTVTELSPDAFESCVSLQRVSLPNGLTADLGGGWVVLDDFTDYNGDNGPSRPSPEEEE